jgi:peptide/nickel transport system substrate-binding protein
MTNDGLVAFNEVSGLAGAQLVPDLAVSLPTPTDGNRTYTFRLRSGIRYSNGRRVRASDVRATFERYFEVSEFPSAYYDHIVGAARCKRPSKHCDLASGIVVNDAAQTVTFHLTAADPDFLYALALPGAYVLPAGTSPHETGTRPLPATGPYVIAGYRPEHVLRFIRNRYFHEWSRAAQPDGYPDRIVFQFAKTPDEAVNAIIGGRADAFGSIGGVPSRSLLNAIETRHASQVQWTSFERIFALFLNTRLAPFDRLGVRKALNYAADRAAAVRVAGGPDVADASCQILPPNFPSYRPYCPYSAGTAADGGWKKPDLAKARALVAASGTRGMKVTFWSGPLAEGYDVYAVKLLRSLGYRATIKALSPTKYTSYAGAQIGFLGWTSDYPAPSGFFVPLLTCSSYLPGSADNANFAGFCDPHIDRAIKHAQIEQTANPEAAGRLWQRVDRETVDQAPWVPLSSPNILNVLSKRVGNFQFSPMWSMLIDQLWVR